jgi:hypothetical protein
MYRLFEQALQSAKHLGIEPELLKRDKKWPLEDQVGFWEAMLILWQSLQKGKNTSEYQQFDSVRKIRSLSTNIKMSRADKAYDGVSFKDGGKTFTLTKSGTNSVFFTKFIKGCEKRMGRLLKQDAALSVELLLIVLKNLEDKLQLESTTIRRKRVVIMLGAALVDQSVFRIVTN